MKWTIRKALVTGAAFIAVVNTIVLAGAAYNRGERDSTLRLSERELMPRWTRDKDNSGLALELDWRVVSADRDSYRFEYGGHGDPAWLDASKMAALGFDVSLPDGPFEGRRLFWRQPAREVYLVLEMDGPAYQESQRQAAAAAEQLRASGSAEDSKRAERILANERVSNSRLFVVDAGLDPQALRARWPDRSRHAVVKGQVAPSGYGRGGLHRGSVRSVSVAAVHVPLEMRSVFEGAVRQRGFASGAARDAVRYDAELAFGRRLEPWLAAASRK